MISLLGYSERRGERSAMDGTHGGREMKAERNVKKVRN
jgi:hypothetical protein